ncbi:MAG: sugar phosphate nucleotidyltransferase [Elusimicrobia bacterium]|nr:sugar phosphate nucleotidyltransferase [Elusimicrobiota bacterium]
MAQGSALQAADVLVLCGGLGRRLREAVPDRPKPMAEVAGRPFLDILLDYVSGFGSRRFILCAGYMADRIRKHYVASAASGREVLVSCEDRPLGTAGAIKNAESLLRSSSFFVMNGDSLCRADLRRFWDFHQGHDSRASVVLAPPEPGSDYGSVSLDPQGRVTGFVEKSEAGPGQLMNAGIYLFTGAALAAIPAGRPTSLERDLLPALAREGLAWGWPVAQRVVDIGTPQRYAEADARLRAEPPPGG